MTQEKENYSKEEKRTLKENVPLLTTLYNIQKYFDVDPSHYSEQSILWSESESYSPDVDLDCTIEEAIENSLNDYFDNHDPDIGYWSLLNIKQRIIGDKNFKFLTSLKKYLPFEYRLMIDGESAGPPTLLARPVPFFLINRNAGNSNKLTNSLIKEYGKTVMTISKSALTANDLKTLYSLCILMKRQKLVPFTYEWRDLWYIETTLTEIAKTMYISNPRSLDVKNGILHSLQRMAECVIKYSKAGKVESFGSIVAYCAFLNKDKVRIYLNEMFLSEMQSGYVELDRELFFKLSDAEALLYFFLSSQKSYCIHEQYKINMFKLWEYALRGLNERPKNEIRHKIKKTLNSMVNRGILTYECDDNDMLTIRTKQNNPELKKAQKPDIKKDSTLATSWQIPAHINVRPNNQCPYNHQFGIDTDKNKDCELCPVWDYCIEEMENNNDMLTIRTKQNNPELKKAQKPDMKPARIIVNPERQCPHGHEFGVDTDKYKDCELCRNWDDCIEEKENA